jgi:hypothetical protein
MLSLLARGTERLLDVWLEPTDSRSLSLPSSEDVETYSIDISALNGLLPSSNFPWYRVASVCGQTLSPIYRKVQHILNEDLEHVAQLLSELEPFEEEVVQHTDLETLPQDSCPRYSTDIDLHHNPPSSACRKRLRLSSPVSQAIPGSMAFILVTTHPPIGCHNSHLAPACTHDSNNTLFFPSSM